MDINAEAAILLAEMFQCQVMESRCQDCTAPLVMVPKQQMPFCVVCTAKRLKAAQDRELLVKARLADQGIVIEDLRPAPGDTPQPKPTHAPDDDESTWPTGWVL